MRLFKNQTYTWWQLGLFKVLLLIIGGFIGACVPDFFRQHVISLVILGAILWVYITLISFRKDK